MKYPVDVGVSWTGGCSLPCALPWPPAACPIKVGTRPGSAAELQAHFPLFPRVSSQRRLMRRRHQSKVSPFLPGGQGAGTRPGGTGGLELGSPRGFSERTLVLPWEPHALLTAQCPRGQPGAAPGFPSHRPALGSSSHFISHLGHSARYQLSTHVLLYSRPAWPRAVPGETQGPDGQGVGSGHSQPHPCMSQSPMRGKACTSLDWMV